MSAHQVAQQGAQGTHRPAPLRAVHNECPPSGTAKCTGCPPASTTQRSTQVSAHQVAQQGAQGAHRPAPLSAVHR
eukprot:jgi/Botrbrau1/21065/Bobra.0144s0064.1